MKWTIEQIGDVEEYDFHWIIKGECKIFHCYDYDDAVWLCDILNKQEAK